MKKIFVGLFLLLVSASVFAAAKGDSLLLLNQGNDLYARGQYDKAAGVYENLLAQKELNASLYYNLGDAYYKTQRYGRAVACFERAARLKPRDPDIRFNLNFLRTFVKEPVEPFPEILLTSLNNQLSLNELTALCSVFYFLLVLGIIFYTLSKQQGFLIFNLACLLAVLVLSGWLFVKYDREVSSREAIVILGPADVRNGPGFENSVGFTLPEGRKVAVLGGKDDWAAVGLKNEGLKGWLEKKYLEEI